MCYGDWSVQLQTENAKQNAGLAFAQSRPFLKVWEAEDHQQPYH